MSAEQDLLAETLDALLGDQCGPEVVTAAEGGWAPALWKTLEEAGLTLIGVPEEAGGSGGGLAEAATVLSAAGRYAAPVPLAESSLLAGWALAASGLPLPAGPLALALPGRGEELTFMAGNGDGGRRLVGRLAGVPWAGVAARLVVVAPDEGGAVSVGVVDPAAVALGGGRTVAGEPSGSVAFEGTALAGDEVVPAGPGVTPEALWRRGALSRALLMAGALDRLLDLSVSYASERHQFGRPIARFQAVQQQLAVLAGEVAAARAAVGNAVEAADEGEAEAEIAVAKVRVGEAAGVAGAIAHQVHGAIGFTMEHRLHHFTRRLWSWRDEYGHEAHWAERLGRLVAARGPAGLWSLLASRPRP